MKQSDTLWLSDTPSILLDSWGVHFYNRVFCIFFNGWINCKDGFHTDTFKEKLVILQSIGITIMKSKETRVITYTPADIIVII